MNWVARHHFYRDPEWNYSSFSLLVAFELNSKPEKSKNTERSCFSESGFFPLFLDDFKLVFVKPNASADRASIDLNNLSDNFLLHINVIDWTLALRFVLKCLPAINTE